MEQAKRHHEEEHLEEDQGYHAEEDLEQHGCSCCAGQHDGADAEAPKWRLWLSRLGIGGGALLLALGLLFGFPHPAGPVLYLIAYLLVGWEVVWQALRNIAKGQVFDENFLMGVASIGALAIGEYPEAVAVMLFYQVGEAFQHYAVGRSRRSIATLMDIRPDFANLKEQGGTRRVSPEEVAVGALILVKPGEKVPLDGVVTEGLSALDTSALTGESLPRDVAVGSEVLSGSVNSSGLLTIRVTKGFGESTVSKILELVENASRHKAPVENFITKFARYYTPAVVFFALALALLPPLILPGAGFADWIHRALVFLVVSCPCALVISIPLGFFGGIGGASRRGVLVKGGNYLEALNNVDTVIFDKTGTLTQGFFSVSDIVPASCSREELLYYTACAERYSGHPIALSVVKEYGKPIPADVVEAYEEVAGCGVRVRVAGRQILAGNQKLLNREGILCPAVAGQGTLIFVAIDGQYAGHFVISDRLKPDSKEAIAKLRAAGVKHLAMLTGDRAATAEKVGKELNLDAVWAELLPDQKVEKLEELTQNRVGKGSIVFVGDGINDAPVLARADVGVAMGGLGSDAAIEAADIVLMTDEPAKLAEGIHIAKRTRHIVWQNIIFALGVKAIFLLLGALGIATMWEAVFGDVGVALIAILNAMRAMRG